MEMIDRLETPSILVDMQKVRVNLKRMADDVLRSGCALRPHVKTHKVPELARLAVAYGACGITVAPRMPVAIKMLEGPENDGTTACCKTRPQFGRSRMVSTR